MKAYNPNVDPDPEAWLASDEESRIDLVVRYHRRQGIQGSAGRVHSIVHVIVENQLAMNEPVVVDTLARLCREGLDRHSAIHAIGSVLAQEIYHLLKGRARGEDAKGAYSGRLKELTAADWDNAS